MKKSIPILLVFGCIASCEATPIVIHSDPSGAGGSSSSSNSSVSSSTNSTSSSSSSSSSSGQGSGGNNPGLPCDPCEAKDGLRLVRQRNRIDGVDGLTLFQGNGIYDTLLKTACTALTAEDGIVRCMPSTPATIGLFFTDTGCSANIAYAFVPMCAMAPKYVAEAAQQLPMCAENTKSIWYTIGSEYAGPSYFKNNGVCTATPPLTNYKYYSLGNKIAPSEFVQLTVQTIP
jgi:hypothetical protein